MGATGRTTRELGRTTPWLVFALVVLAAAGAAAIIFRAEDAHHEAHFALAAEAQFDSVETGIHMRLRPVQHVGSVFEFEAGEVSEDSFLLLAQSIPLADEPALVAVQWIPRQAGDAGAPSFPVRYSYTPGEAVGTGLGVDLWGDPMQRRMLVEAQKHRRLWISPWYRDSGTIRFRAFRPVYDKGPGQPELLGFVSGVYRVRELMRASLCPVAKMMVELYIADPRAKVDSQFYCSGEGVRPIPRNVVPSSRHHRLARTLRIDGARWNGLAVAKPGYFEVPLWTPVAVGLSGIALAGVLTALLSFLLNRETRVREMVRVRTEELQQRTADLERRTDQLEAINAELEEFAYVASHDLKAPLRAVSQLASWIEEDAAGRLDAETRERLSLIRGRVVRMDNLIDGLLAYSRAGKSADERLARTSLDEAAREVAGELLLPDGFRIEIGPLPSVKAPAPHVRQILQNLIDNAVSYHDRPESGTVWLRAREDGRYWQLEVADDGPGIPPEERERVFRMFTSLDSGPGERHSGIGLAVVRKLVRSYGGRIDVTANEPRGALFRIWWPK